MADIRNILGKIILTSMGIGLLVLLWVRTTWYIPLVCFVIIFLLITAVDWVVRY